MGDTIQSLPATELEKKKLHPVVEGFPRMPDDEYQVLKVSIQQNGLDEPIVIWNDMIVDGRHRAKAVIELGSTATIKDVSHLSEADTVRLVLRANAIRRHLTTGQKALMAHDLAKGLTSVNLQKINIAAAAKMFGVSPEAVNMLVRALKDAPELRQAIHEGKVTVHGAKTLAEHIASISQSDRTETINDINTSDRKTLKEKAKAAAAGNKSKKSTPVSGKMEMPGLTGRYVTLIAVLENIPKLPDALRSLHSLLNEHRLAPAHAIQLKAALTPIRKMDLTDLIAGVDGAIVELDAIIKDNPEPDMSGA